MGEKCRKHTQGKPCDIRASYKLYLSPGNQLTYRCASHMAMDIVKMQLADSELRTIQKTD